MSKKVMQQALEALEESVDLVRHEYSIDWRHGLPTRKAQLESMKAGLDAHEAAITALSEALAAPQPAQPAQPAQPEQELEANQKWKADVQKVRDALDPDDWCGDERMMDVLDRVLNASCCPAFLVGASCLADPRPDCPRLAAPQPAQPAQPEQAPTIEGWKLVKVDQGERPQGFMPPKYFDKLTGFGIPDPRTIGALTQARAALTGLVADGLARRGAVCAIDRTLAMLETVHTASYTRADVTAAHTKGYELGLTQRTAPPQRQPLTEAEYMKVLGPLRDEIFCSAETLRRIVRVLELAIGDKP